MAGKSGKSFGKNGNIIHFHEKSHRGFFIGKYGLKSSNKIVDFPAIDTAIEHVANWNDSPYFDGFFLDNAA